jgi:hypothetical protein
VEVERNTSNVTENKFLEINKDKSTFKNWKSIFFCKLVSSSNDQMKKNNIIFLFLLFLYSCKNHSSYVFNTTENQLILDDIELKKHYCLDSNDLSYLFTVLNQHEKLFNQQRELIKNKVEKISIQHESDVVGILNYSYSLKNNDVGKGRFYIFPNEIIVFISDLKENYSRIIIFKSQQVYLNLVKNVDGRSFVNLNKNPIGKIKTDQVFNNYLKLKMRIVFSQI